MAEKRYPFHLLLADEYFDIPPRVASLTSLRNYASMLTRATGAAFRVSFNVETGGLRAFRLPARVAAQDALRTPVTVPDDVPAGLPAHLKTEETAKAFDNLDPMVAFRIRSASFLRAAEEFADRERALRAYGFEVGRVEENASPASRRKTPRTDAPHPRSTDVRQIFEQWLPSSAPVMKSRRVRYFVVD